MATAEVTDHTLMITMNHCVRFILLMILATSTMLAQGSPSLPKLSPLTHRYLRDAAERLDALRRAKASGNAEKLAGEGSIYLGGLIKVGPGIDEARLRALGVRVGTKAGAIWSVRVPLEHAEEFTRVAGIEYIQLDDPATPTLDSARKATRVDSVHAGYALPMPYNGEGVVVGVVDAGFDYRHPTLRDTTGSGYRVRRVWEQKNDQGAPPAGYSYGTEMTDSAAMWGRGNDDGESHGTHVAGICAGSGFGSRDNSRYRGMAYDADLVLVGITPDKSQWVNTGVSDMIDGIGYVFDYAASVGKPAVVNLSWGSPIGPRDGSGLFSQALDNLTGPGRIFVCSAGNNGENAIHVGKTFTPTDTMVQTFLGIPVTPIGKTTWADIWGDSGRTFCAQVTLYKDTVAISTTGFICLDDSMHRMRLVGSNNDTCFVDITTSSAEFNGKPRIFLDFRSNVADLICISIKGSQGKVNMWNSFVHNTTGYYGTFASAGRAWAVNGNSESSISDIASSKSAITVGAYASKITWTSVAGKSFSYASYVGRGKLVPFSSRGPAADGRVKPDITGPGMTVGSAISSFDSSFITGEDSVTITEIWRDPVDGREYRYGMLSGTSMSSPAVSGIVALLLQIKPDLTPQQIKDIFTETSIRDNFTGTIPPGGNNNWGNGKVNAYGAARRVLQLSAGVEKGYRAVSLLDVYPNPSRGPVSVVYTSDRDEEVGVEIHDLLGRVVVADRWRVVAGDNIRRYDLMARGAGIYFVTVTSGTRSIPAGIVVE